MLQHLRRRPSFIAGIGVAVVCSAVCLTRFDPITSCLVGWDLGILAYTAVFTLSVWRSTTEGIRRVAAKLDEGRWGVLWITVFAAIASLGAIVAELANAHGSPHAGWLGLLSGVTVVLSWFFIQTIFATHYAHEYWGHGGALNFPGNDEPGYSEFLYFSFCMGVAFQVSDVSTQSAAMRRLVLAHSLVGYLFNTAIIALGVNIAASLAG
ncbi:DUF1345 domain-containing protein [Acidisphaera sp. L21]|uniref:DUF1345 domain-containing protein n=1 Tax=Acidisphaera sp. L21 TaxID=1641851 RepID=UPI0020B154BB|nr:DUF1345 domain-containing protein [Acidisphaera sp. L21]